MQPGIHIKTYDENLDLDSPGDLFEFFLRFNGFGSGFKMYDLCDTRDEYKKWVAKYSRNKQYNFTRQMLLGESYGWQLWINGKT